MTTPPPDEADRSLEEIKARLQELPPERRQAVRAGMAQLLIDMAHLSTEEPIGWVLDIRDPERPYPSISGVVADEGALRAYADRVRAELNADGDGPPIDVWVRPLFSLEVPGLTQLVADPAVLAELRREAGGAGQAWEALDVDDYSTSPAHAEGWALGVKYALQQLGLAGDLDLQP